MHEDGNTYALKSGRFYSCKEQQDTKLMYIFSLIHEKVHMHLVDYYLRIASLQKAAMWDKPCNSIDMHVTDLTLLVYF